jgi:uncharacterized membrane protein
LDDIARLAKPACGARIGDPARSRAVSNDCNRARWGCVGVVPTRQEHSQEIRMTPSKSAVSFAAAAALIAITGASMSTPVMAKGTAAQVHCYGVNSCKGQSDCKSGNHDCKGQNDCKGQGFKAESKAQCKVDGGSLTESK